MGRSVSPPAANSQTALAASDVALSLDENLTIEEWELVGRRLRERDSKLKWWIGDWLLFGRKHFGDRTASFHRAAELTGYSESTLEAARWLSSRFAPQRRIASLSWHHYSVIATLDTATQDYWIARAIEEGMSTHDLTAAVRSSREPSEPKKAPVPQTSPAEVIPDWRPRYRFDNLRIDEGKRHAFFIRKVDPDVTEVLPVVRTAEDGTDQEVVAFFLGKHARENADRFLKSGEAE